MKIQSIGLTTNCHAGQHWYNRTQSNWTQPNITQGIISCYTSAIALPQCCNEIKVKQRIRMHTKHRIQIMPSLQNILGDTRIQTRDLLLHINLTTRPPPIKALKDIEFSEHIMKCNLTHTSAVLLSLEIIINGVPLAWWHASMSFCFVSPSNQLWRQISRTVASFSWSKHVFYTLDYTQNSRA